MKRCALPGCNALDFRRRRNLRSFVVGTSRRRITPSTRGCNRKWALRLDRRCARARYQRCSFRTGCLCLRHAVVGLNHHKQVRRADAAELHCFAQPARRRHRICAASVRHPRLTHKPLESCAQLVPRHHGSRVLEEMLVSMGGHTAAIGGLSCLNEYYLYKALITHMYRKNSSRSDVGLIIFVQKNRLVD